MDADIRKFSPGNYIGTSAPINEQTWDAITRRLGRRPQWKGAAIRYNWPMLERRLGEYAWAEKTAQKGFLDIERRLREISRYPGCRLIIIIHMKNFGVDAHSVPRYMRNAAYGSATTPEADNGEYQYVSGNGGPGGWVPCMHIPATKKRWIALMTALAERFDSNPYLEGIIFTEASVSRPVYYHRRGTTGPGRFWPSQSRWYSNMADAFATVMPKFKQTWISQWINGPRNEMATFVPTIVAAGVGLGLTDVCKRSMGFWYHSSNANTRGVTPARGPAGSIAHCLAAAGRVVLTHNITAHSLEGSCSERGQPHTDATNFTNYRRITGETHFPAFDGSIDPDHGGTPYETKQQIRDFAVNDLLGTHLIWLDRAQNDRMHPNTPSRDVVDSWIADPDSEISTVTTRPQGW